MGKNLIFQNKKVENFKNLEILQSKRDFFNFLQAITFDTFKWKLKIFYICSILGQIQENKESNSNRLTQKPWVLAQNWEKMNILWS